MSIKPIYRHIASRLMAIANCRKSSNVEWEAKHLAVIEYLVKNYFPSGSGFDAGTVFDFDLSRPNKLVFHTSFHHMDEGGMYDGWTEHSVIVSPDLALEFDLKVTGRDQNDIKDYIGEMFSAALSDAITDDCEPIRNVVEKATA